MVTLLLNYNLNNIKKLSNINKTFFGPNKKKKLREEL